jgi:hypothetical protein
MVGVVENLSRHSIQGGRTSWTSVQVVGTSGSDFPIEQRHNIQATSRFAPVRLDGIVLKFREVSLSE